MGSDWEDRLQLRRIEWAGLAVAAIAGGALPIGTVSGDAGRLLVTFLGLVAASILPTISLILGSMTASGRSVQSIGKLRAELSAAMDALFLLFGLAALAVLCLITLAVPTPAILGEIPQIPIIMHRFGQALVVMAATLIVLRAGQIPAILCRSLDIRHNIAEDEARKKTIEAAPRSGDMKATFTTHPDFGKPVSLSELHDQEPH